MRPGSTVAWLALCLISSLADPSLAQTTPPPSDYDDFEVWDSHVNTESLQSFIAGRTHIYIPEGKHEIDNPVWVLRSGPLFVHGDGRNLTTLIAMDPSEPLFYVVAADRMGVANLRIQPDSEDAVFTAFHFSPFLDVPRFELQDTVIRRGGIVIKKEGTYVLQGNIITGARDPATPDELAAGILVDDPDAELYVVGGKIVDATTNIYQERGHVEVHGTLFNNSRFADIVLESPSPHDAHFVVATRTEGTHDLSSGSYLVRVPATSDPVDVVVKANHFTGGDSAPGAMVEYNAAGTLWALGNKVSPGRDPLESFETVVSGNAPSGTVVAVGNDIDVLNCVADPFPVNAGQLLNARNRHDAKPCDPSPIPYNIYWERDMGGDPLDMPDFPEPPLTAHGGSVPLLDLPRMNSQIGALIDVTEPPYNATPDDDSDDDSGAIQAALDSGRRAKIYLPAGTYHIQEPLRFDPNTCLAPGCQSGGRIVGAGSDVTVIHNVQTDPAGLDSFGDITFGQVFDVRSLSYATIQGITVRTDVDVLDQAKGAFHLGDAHSPSTIANNFYDVAFDGGDFGLGILLNDTSQADATLCVNCEFKNARVGLVNGGGNAVGNLVHGGLFKDNDFAVSQGINIDGSSVTPTGGTVAILSGESEGTLVRDFDILHRVFYVNDFVSTAPQLAYKQCGHGLHTATFDNTLLSPPDPPTRPYLENVSSNSINFLHSSADEEVEMDLGICGTKSETSMLSLFSNIPGWENTVTKPDYTFIDRIDAP